jgi:Calcineurin-like phosphoesterase
MSEQHYDIIGDVHGHADALCRLLRKLGYTETQGAFRHDHRQAIFVGDFVDRGPGQKEVLRIARNMCEVGAANAVLGNHEFNAIAWATPNGEGGFLREHSEKNKHQHSEFLRQLDEGSAEYYDALHWFRQLPVWLEFGGLRVVHACWHEPSRAALKLCLDSRNCLTETGLREALQRGSTAYAAADILMKGPEQRLPPGMSFLDASGNKRHDVRIRWWDSHATTFKQAAFGMDDRIEELPDVELPIDYRYMESKPVLFGHYWMEGEPTITFPNAACLDFSVARKGYLTAYRWSGERELTLDHLVYVSAEAPAD